MLKIIILIYCFLIGIMVYFSITILSETNLIKEGNIIMLERRLEELWRDLQGKKPHLPHFLSEIYLDGIRGFKNLRVVFDYPVSVIAGGNTTRK